MTGARCDGCGAPIEWGVTAKPKRIPLEPDGVLHRKAPNVVIVGTFRNGTVAVDVVKSGDPRATRITHFAVCPDAERFRRRHRSVR
jgi:Family of unknown function (DUF6083)